MKILLLALVCVSLAQSGNSQDVRNFVDQVFKKVVRLINENVKNITPDAHRLIDKMVGYFQRALPNVVQGPNFNGGGKRGVIPGNTVANGGIVVSIDGVTNSQMDPGVDISGQTINGAIVEGNAVADSGIIVIIDGVPVQPNGVQIAGNIVNNGAIIVIVNGVQGPNGVYTGGNTVINGAIIVIINGVQIPNGVKIASNTVKNGAIIVIIDGGTYSGVNISGRSINGVIVVK